MSIHTTNDFQPFSHVPLRHPHDYNFSNITSGKNADQQEPEKMPVSELNQAPEKASVLLTDGLNENFLNGFSLNEYSADIDELADFRTEVHGLDAQNESFLCFGMLNRQIRGNELYFMGLHEFVEETEYLPQRVQNNRENALHFRHFNIPHQGGNHGNFVHDPVFIVHFTDDIDTKPFTNDDILPPQNEGRGPLTCMLTTESDEET